MRENPYSGLPQSAFWKTGVAQEDPYSINSIYHKKFVISPQDKIATAGSCFAQHISRNLKISGYNFLDTEPPPKGLAKELRQKYGFSMYSARYGNIYTVRQLLQLAQEAAGDRLPQNWIWEKNKKYFDALRPNIEPEGFDSPDEVISHRQHHLLRVKELFKKLDLFIFTLGLTEMWIHKASGTVYPTAPGVLAGEFSDNIYEFRNASYNDITLEFKKFEEVVKKIRKGRDFKIILTVSPVPLTATADNNHILVSNTYSKSTLRSAAGFLSESSNIDYFPSYEIVTNPRNISMAYQDNLRSVRDDIIESVMRHFFSQHPVLEKEPTLPRGKRRRKPNKSHLRDHIQCEEALLDAFSK